MTGVYVQLKSPPKLSLLWARVAFATSDGLCPPKVASATEGGEGGIRTLDTSLSSYNGLANRPFRPLRHLSNKAKGIRLKAQGLTTNDLPPTICH